MVKFTTAEDLLPIFTDMRGRNRRLGDPPDHERGIHLPGEIRLRDTDGGRPRARLADEVRGAAEALRERIAAGEVTLDALMRRTSTGTSKAQGTTNFGVLETGGKGPRWCTPTTERVSGRVR